MSQRNPMNERNQREREERKGSSHKSAARAKPVKTAAASVYVDHNAGKPVKQNWLQRTVSSFKNKDTALEGEKDPNAKKSTVTDDAKDAGKKAYYNPNNDEYTKWRRIWWVCIILGVITIIPPVVYAEAFIDNNALSFVFLFLGYGFLILAVVIDVTKVRAARKKAQAGAEYDRSKEATKARKEFQKQERERAEREAAEKQAKAEAKAAKKAARKNKGAASNTTDSE